jgi:predicted nucleic acid-binding protein
VHESIVCLDSGVWIKFLVVEEPTSLTDAATRLVRRAISNNRLIAPAFAWMEIGSVLRKKVRQRLIQAQEVAALWTAFGALPIEYLDSPTIRERSWEIASQRGLPTLYDAAFLACTELIDAPTPAIREFWTADGELVRALEANRPSYLRVLGESAVE